MLYGYIYIFGWCDGRDISFHYARHPHTHWKRIEGPTNHSGAPCKCLFTPYFTNRYGYG